MGWSHDTALRTQCAYSYVLARTNLVVTDTDHLYDHAAQIHLKLGIATYKLTGRHGKSSDSVAWPDVELTFETCRIRLDAGEFDGSLAECFYPIGDGVVDDSSAIKLFVGVWDRCLVWKYPRIHRPADGSKMSECSYWK